MAPPPAKDPKLGPGDLAAQIESSAVRQLYADPAAATAQAIDKVAAARVWLLKEKPFFGVLARALRVEASLHTTAFRLLADDRLLVNPIVTLELKFPALCARIAHTTLHAALGALVRRGPREPLRWNAAHDLAIDPLLRAAGFALGPSLVLSGIDVPALADGASAEQYYAALPEGSRPSNEWCDLTDPPIDTPPAIAGTFTRQDDGEGNEPSDDKSSGNSGQGPAPNEGEPDQGEPNEGEPDTTDPVEARGRELQWKMRLGAALEEERAAGGKTFGEIPGWIDDLVRATIEPPPDWSAALQRSVSVLTRTDRTFLRPSRRMSALVGPNGEWPDVVAMPGRRVMPAGKLVTVVDTSASIDPPTLARFFGALAAVATAEGFDEVRVVQADAEVTRDETLYAADLLFFPIEIQGRGGTDFGPALRLLAAESKRLGERFTVVYLTDLDGRFPPPNDVVPLEVLWVVPFKPAKMPPFGKLVEMAIAKT